MPLQRVGLVVGLEDAERHPFRVTAEGITLVTPDMLGQQLHITR